MSDVKWIKITTDIFDDEKILLIESMPDADAVITIWFKLLCLAGKQNNSGVFMLNDKIAYTDEMFATIFRRPLNTVRMALDYFEKFGMIERLNGVVTIPNWDKHQSLNQLESKKEYMRNYMAERRAAQRALCEPNSKTNSKANVSCAEEEKEEKEEKDKDKNKKNKKANADPFAAYKGDENLYQALMNFVEMRKLMKKPMTVKAKEMLLAELGEYPDEEWIPMLNQSVKNNWLSVYPLKQNAKKNAAIADNTGKVDMGKLQAMYDRI